MASSAHAIDAPALLRDGELGTHWLDLDQPATKQWALETTRQLEAMGCLHERGRYAPTPITMPRRRYADMLGDVVRLLHLARRVAVQSGQVLAWARPDQRDLVQAGLQQPLLPPIARPDGIVVDGHLKLLELNLDSGLGGYFEVELLQQRLAQLERSGPGDTFLVPTVWEGLQQYIATLMRGIGRTEIDLAVMVDPHLTAYNRSHADILVAHIARHMPNVRARIVASDALRPKRGRMSDGETGYDILWRFGAMTHAPELVRAAVEAQRLALQTETLVVSSPADLGVDGKLVLASLSELADDGSTRLSPAERDLVRRLVPWTRFVRPGPVRFGERTLDLPALARRERERLVLKRSHSKSSQQVFIGCETDDAQWQQRLEAALADPVPWVLQENMRSAMLRFGYLGTGDEPAWAAEQRYSINPFIFGDALAAPFIRLERDERNRRLAIANIGAMATCGLVLTPDTREPS